MEIIRTEKLEKTYNERSVAVHALRGVDLAIEKGEFLVIAGQSGSGKTTLLNIIGTLDLPTSGKVFIDGRDLAGRSQKSLADLRLHQIGFVFQAYNLIPVLSAVENVEFSMMLMGISSKIRREKAMKVLDELGIADLAHSRPNKMSGGQQQRVAVARAIVNDPLIILADEPTANLDSKAGENLLDIMQKMNESKGITFVFSSHDEKVIRRGRRLIYLEDGSIIKETVNP